MVYKEIVKEQSLSDVWVSGYLYHKLIGTTVSSPSVYFRTQSDSIQFESRTARASYLLSSR